MKPITKDLIVALFPKAKDIDVLTESMIALFPKYELNTVNRIAGFLAQCSHESADFTLSKENLNYSSEGLLKVFPKYFKTNTEAVAYARKAEKIANKVYANRYGNGDEASGDGYRYSGKGFIQLTFKDNYKAFAKDINIEMKDVVEYLLSTKGALESALWYWKTRNLNKYCDSDDIKGMSKVVNGGTIGLEDRTARYEKYKKALS